MNTAHKGVSSEPPLGYISKHYAVYDGRASKESSIYGRQIGALIDSPASAVTELDTFKIEHPDAQVIEFTRYC